MSDGTNLQSFQTMLAVCTALGATYQPTNTAIALGAMTAEFNNAHSLLDHFTALLVPYKLAVNDREATFAGSGKLATSVQAAYASCGTTDQNVEDMKSFVRKIQGGRAAKITPDDPSTPEDEGAHNSVSQRGYSDVVEHWENIIALAGATVEYTPNEVHLQVATLQTMVTAMSAANQAVIAAAIPADNARTGKNNILYNSDASLFEKMKLVKTYFKAAFGATSPQYQQISGLEFTKPGKR